MGDPDLTLPEAANRRLTEDIFTSDLSVDELVCLEDLEVDPLGFVLGSSIYHIGWQVAWPGQSQEMDVLSRAMYNARSLAIGRMEAEAKSLGAHGIVGVHFTINRYKWGPELLEFLVVGTGVRARDPSVGLKPLHGRPFTSDLSGQDLWKLVRAGYRPVHLVMGTCVYHVAWRSPSQWFRSVGRNVEMTNYTQATYEARELAMDRMETEATDAGGEGIVAVKLEERSWGWASHVIEFFALGTAVTRADPDARPPEPRLVLSLDS